MMSLGICTKRPNRKLNKAALEQRSLNKEGFNNQCSKAIFSECP